MPHQITIPINIILKTHMTASADWLDFDSISQEQEYITALYNNVIQSMTSMIDNIENPDLPNTLRQLAHNIEKFNKHLEKDDVEIQWNTNNIKMQ